jgi:hypothetical protein
MPASKKNGELDLVWGIFVVGAIFFASPLAAMCLLFLVGWNPLERGTCTWAGFALALILGAISVVAIFRWASKRSKLPFAGQ